MKKKLLLPTFALALACLPAKAQQAAEPAAGNAAPAPTPTAETARPHSAAPLLGDRVQFTGAKLPEIVDFLNTKLKKQGEAPMNLVLGPGLEDVLVPTMTLQNVSAIDVINVVAKLAGLSMESVPADSGGIAAWILTKRNTVELGSGFGVTFSGSMGGEGAGSGVAGIGGDGGSGGVGGLSVPMLTPPGAAPGVAAPAAGGGGSLGVPGATFADGLNPVAPPRKLAKWTDPAASPSGGAQVSRVIGIGKIYDQLAGKDDDARARKEGELVETLSMIADEQHLACKVRLYRELHVIVVKGEPEAVALIEQTIAALKENAGVKNPAVGGAPRTF